MLTVAECRVLLGEDAPESDRDVEALRDLVYLLAGSVLDSLPTASDQAEQETS